MKKSLIILIAVAFLFSTVGCSKIEKTDPSARQPVKMEDYPVSIDTLQFLKSPDTVISLSPALTEIIFEIGAGEKLIARSDYCNYPENVTAVPSVGSPAKPDIDTIVSFKPDLVVTQSPIAKVDVNVLEQNGIRVLTIPQPKTFFELLDTYAKLSLVFLGNNSADKMTTEKIEPLDSALFTAQELNYTQNFVFIMTPELAVATGDTLSGNMLSVFGENIAKDYKNYIMPVEDIVAASPAVIFVSKDVDLTALPEELRNLPAIANGKAITIDYSFFERPTSRISTVIQDITSKMGTPVVTTPAETTQTSEETTTQATS